MAPTGTLRHNTLVRYWPFGVGGFVGPLLADAEWLVLFSRRRRRIYVRRVFSRLLDVPGTIVTAAAKYWTVDRDSSSAWLRGRRGRWRAGVLVSLEIAHAGGMNLSTRLAAELNQSSRT